MKYAMLIHYKPDYYEALSEDEQKAVFAEYRALAEDPRARGSAQLQPIETATTVRVQDGQTLTSDGPYANNKRCSAPTTFSRSTTLTRRSGWPRGSRRLVSAGAIEVRPLVER